jgi:putative oxidoreductase
MVTAIRRLHWQNGPWNQNGGYEYSATILAALAALVETGPGRWSVDAARGRIRGGLGWAFGALGAGAVGSAIAIGVGSRKAEAEGETDVLGEPRRGPAERELRRAA